MKGRLSNLILTYRAVGTLLVSHEILRSYLRLMKKGANLKFVILRLVLHDDPSTSPIVTEDSKQSLENVNLWNLGFWNGLPEGERHDIAIWLTRLEIGKLTRLQGLSRALYKTVL